MNQNTNENKELQMSSVIEKSLRTITTCVNLLWISSIIFFIGLIAIGFYTNSTFGIIITATIAIFAIIYLYPFIKNITFAKDVKKALDTKNQEKLESGTESFANALQYTGIIFTISVLLSFISIAFL